ncbi:MAG TPA: hypothetical protein QGF95_22540 [Candidatus Latescibacteria bacterium]|jgi:hypothetical protein|nr:hypothetical protein [Gemmatimonadaceae bacterium]MDP6016220.1 hypothetical protein [Candidatus Latescibacterota bacterium]HJP33336.1 hypothetical protein [Candidatus Latescibacterota bacterium]
MIRLGLSALLLTTAISTAPVAAEGGAGRFWRSLLIPGWGQHAGGRDSAASRFVILEGALWAGYAGLSGISGIRRTTYRTYAATHAGAQTSGKTGEYFDDLGFYATHHQHNQFARVDGPDALLYANTPDFSWEWDADGSRERYRDLRNSAETMERNALFVTGLVAVNHLVSAIHAGRMDREAGLAESGLSAIVIDWQWRPERLDLVLRRSF